ncbi:hypothetical protein RSAG8_01221, partial [Rhizoctonia solani AG-8 WAC10335]
MVKHTFLREIESNGPKEEKDKQRKEGRGTKTRKTYLEHRYTRRRQRLVIHGIHKQLRQISLVEGRDFSREERPGELAAFSGWDEAVGCAFLGELGLPAAEVVEQSHVGLDQHAVEESVDV